MPGSPEYAPYEGRPSALRSHAPDAAGPALRADGATFRTRPRGRDALTQRRLCGPPGRRAKGSRAGSTLRMGPLAGSRAPSR
ncbi:hypothetical protein GPZ77_32430 [Streptomyces sp. QHH-9511]|nr:hypothetical protein GPZ77_32430 [Streptomyces sp. QHH-9511]